MRGGWANGYLARVAEPVQRGEQVLAPRPRMRGWPGESAVPREEVAVSDPYPIPLRQASIKPHESNERAPVNQSSIVDAEPELPAQSASHATRKSEEQPIQIAKAAAFWEERPDPARRPNSEALEPVLRTAEPTAAGARLEIAGLEGGEGAKLIPDMIARPVPAARQIEVVLPESLEPESIETRRTEKFLRERKSEKSERHWSEEEIEKTAVNRRPASSESVLKSMVVERVADTKAAIGAQQREAKQNSSAGHEHGGREAPPSAGTRVTIGAIEVRTVVRQAATQLASITQAQTPVPATGRNPGSPTGSLARGLGWRFGLVQG
jgi:hypothetical protein